MRAVIVDLHVDTLLRLAEEGGGFHDSRPELHVDPDRLRRGGVRLLACACFTRDGDPEPRAHLRRLLDLAAAVDADDRSPLQRVTTPQELHALPRDRVGMLLTIENAEPLERDLSELEGWYRQGVRIVGLTWNQQNSLASGTSVSDPRGLTPFGREVLSECERLRMTIDLSHLAAPGVDEVLASEVSVIATHCNAHQLRAHPRNLTDAQLRAVAARGGVVGLNCYPPFVGGGTVTTANVAAHACHMAEIMGVEHVALGTDFDGIETTPDDFHSHADLPRLAQALCDVGFDDGQVTGILGGNFMRWWERLEHE